MTPDFFFQVFGKNSLIKSIFEEEKKFDSGTRLFFLEYSSQVAVFWSSEDFKLTAELSEKCNIPATKQSKTA